MYLKSADAYERQASGILREGDISQSDIMWIDKNQLAYTLIILDDHVAGILIDDNRQAIERIIIIRDQIEIIGDIKIHTIVCLQTGTIGRGQCVSIKWTISCI